MLGVSAGQCVESAVYLPSSLMDICDVQQVITNLCSVGILLSISHCGHTIDTYYTIYGHTKLDDIKYY